MGFFKLDNIKGYTPPEVAEKILQIAAANAKIAGKDSSEQADLELDQAEVNAKRHLTGLEIADARQRGIIRAKVVENCNLRSEPLKLR